MKRIGMVFCVVLLVLALALTSAFAEETTGSGEYEGGGIEAPKGAIAGYIEARRAAFSNHEGHGFGTPEEAIAAYIEAQRASDVQGMISTFAIETYVDAYDVKAGLNRLKSFNLVAYMGVPIANEYTRQIKISKRIAEITDALYYQYLMYIWPNELYDSFENPVNFMTGDETEIDEFIESLSSPEKASVLTDIELIDFISVEDFDAGLADRFYSEANQGQLAKIASCYNCDELAERIAHVRIGDKEGYQFMRCARYGDKWYNDNGVSTQCMILGANFTTGGLILADDLNELMN